MGSPVHEQMARPRHIRALSRGLKQRADFRWIGMSRDDSPGVYHGYVRQAFHVGRLTEEEAQAEEIVIHYEHPGGIDVVSKQHLRQLTPLLGKDLPLMFQRQVDGEEERPANQSGNARRNPDGKGDVRARLSFRGRPVGRTAG